MDFLCEGIWLSVASAAERFAALAHAVYRWFAKFRDEGCFEKINYALCSIATGPDADLVRRMRIRR